MEAPPLPAKQGQRDMPYKFEIPKIKQMARPYHPAQLPVYLQTQIRQELVAPPPRTEPDFYQNTPVLLHQQFPSRLHQQQYRIPANQTYYQAVPPDFINQEIMGAIVDSPNLPNVKPTATPSKAAAQQDDKDTVQLLYVPLENLKQKPKVLPQEEKLVRPQLDQVSKPSQIKNIEDEFIKQALEAQKLQEQLQIDENLFLQSTIFTTTPTPKPKKRKAHQPPLAVYMESPKKADVSEVLNVLKQSKSIAVLDSVEETRPHIFIGPSTLTPQGYTKFPLPYLSNVEGNRIERKVEHLPFFVAPLSYRAPEGYSKIPLPSPHVGSVVVSNKDEPEQPPRALPFVQNPDPYKYEPQPLKQTPTTLDSSITKNNHQQYQLLSEAPLRQFSPFTISTTPSYQYHANPSLIAPQFQTPFKFHEDSLIEPKPTAATAAENQQFQPMQQNKYLRLLPKPARVTEATPIIYKPVQELDFSSLFPLPKKPTEASTSRHQYSFNNAAFVSPQPIKETSSVEPSTQNPYLIEEQNYELLKKKPEVITTQRPYEIEESSYKSSRRKPSKSTTTPNPYIHSYDIYTSSPQPAKHTATPIHSSTFANLYSPSILESFHNSKPMPIQQINQFELHQINQFAEENGPTSAGSTQFNDETSNNAHVLPNNNSPSRSSFEEISTIRNKQNVRQRERGTKSTTATPVSTPASTANAYANSKYTVLEDFAIQTKATTTPKYTTEVETIPANVYRLRQEQYQPIQIPNQHEAVRQHILNQELMDKQILKSNRESNEQHLSPIIHNRGQNHQTYFTATEAPVGQFLPGLINNLQNQQNQQAGINYDQNIGGLQDSSIRTLLVPKLLVPTTEGLPLPLGKTTTEKIEIPTKLLPIQSTSSSYIETTTEAKKTRGRYRGSNGRYTTTTSSSRRTINRRRPTSTRTRPTTAEAISFDKYDSTTKKNPVRQRYRTRPKLDYSSTERVFHTSAENKFREPVYEGGFQASVEEPESYMQFEHTINDQQLITLKPNQDSDKEYQQIYSVLPIQVEPTKDETKSKKPVIDYKIIHPLLKKNKEDSLNQKKNESLNTKVDDVLQTSLGDSEREKDTTTKSPVRSRIRGRTRFASSTTFTKPTTTTTTTTTMQPIEKSKESIEEDYYGFIRQPNFNRPATISSTEQSLPPYSSSYKSSEKPFIHVADDDDEHKETTPIHFIGEIRPKYSSTINTIKEEEETLAATTSTPKVKTRIRTRAPTFRQNTNKQSYDEVHSTSTSKPRLLNRGSTHYKVPEKVTQKYGEEDEEVSGGNYPSTYFKAKETTTKSNFQITIDPFDEDTNDQEPYSSINRPNILPSPDTVMQQHEINSLNNIGIEDKNKDFSSSNFEATTFSLLPVKVTETPTQTTQSEGTTTAKKTRRRGAWKLVGHRPVENFETAESQNYKSVLNSFHQIRKSQPKTTPAMPATTAESIFVTLYNMFGISNKDNSPPSSSSTTEYDTPTTTTQQSPTFPEEFTEESKETTTVPLEGDDATNPDRSLETSSATTTTTIKTPTKYKQQHSWEMQTVKTSTSTKVSHETEICYKGRCVKSFNNNQS